MCIAYLINVLLALFWVFDVVNLPFMEIFDTTYPINTLAWFLIWLVMPSIKIVIKRIDKDEK